ncbi:hypothetical protein OJAV_G00211830 [Oryzias javanicus]|uniref:Uncharacterized protein n=1 Tax=Oryzias javanicus TaxID=123683 RepID=A0A437C2Z7_ORYJA|nr:hypothetical protein OJAV_G00211830 [Oryzias javanicus]
MFDPERSKMMWIIAMAYLIVPGSTVASRDCSSCQVKMKNGQYHYTARVTPNTTSSLLDYSWSNETNHPVATQKQSSVPPVNASSDETLVSDRYLGNLALKRHYTKKNGEIDSDDILCCESPHNDPEPTPVSPPPSPGNPGGHLYLWIPAAAVAVVFAAVTGFIYIRKRKKKGFLNVSNQGP